jgi:hypothetical protein
VKNANVAFCVIFWAGKFGVIFWRDFGGGNFGVIFWNFIFENFGGAREVGQAIPTTINDPIYHTIYIILYNRLSPFSRHI